MSKIFGIGWHRTGTTSLCKALEMLGYQTAHYLYELYDPQTHTICNWSTINTYDAVVDFPIPLVVDKLLTIYPKAKYILTTRNSQEWLKSVQFHFEVGNRPDPMRNGKSVWDETSKTDYNHQIHELAYGIRHFDEEVFLKRFLDYEKQVFALFENRRHQLLALDLKRDMNWTTLCSFLETEIPKLAFPNLNSTQNRQKLANSTFLEKW